MKKKYILFLILLLLLIMSCSTKITLLKDEEVARDVFIKFLFVENHGYSRTDGSYTLNKYPPKNMELYSVIFQLESNSENSVNYNLNKTILVADQVLYQPVTSNFDLTGTLKPKRDWIIFHIYFYIPEGVIPSKLILANYGEYYIQADDWHKAF
jgi:hypothetical protein